MTKKKKKKNQDKENQDFIEKKSKSNLPLILSFLAILISLGQLIFTVPLVLKYFDRVEIQAIELGIAKSPNDNNMESSFLIINNGNNTAKNVELHMRILEGDRILFVPESFDLVRGDEKKTSGNLTYKCNELVPGEKVRIYVLSDFNKYLEINSIDTLYYDKKNALPKYAYGPKMVNLKHSLGKIKIQVNDSLYLKKLDY